MNLDTPLDGQFGRAIELDIPDAPNAAATVASFVVHAPAYHPLFVDYTLAAVNLTTPGFGEPKLQFPGATHEILCVTLNPENGPYTREKMAGYAVTGDLPFLTPINVAWQMTGTDDEARYLVQMAARGIVHGLLEPEASNGPVRIRDHWATVLTNTLAHTRGEH